MTTEPVPARVRRSRVRIYRSFFPKEPAPSPASGAASCASEHLNMQPGSLAEVRRVDEILATLDQDKESGGLLWMRGMEKFCRQKLRVFKNVGIIMLEPPGELRKLNKPPPSSRKEHTATGPVPGAATVPVATSGASHG